MTIKLKREYNKNYTKGNLIFPVYINKLSGNSMYTLELPNLNNQKMISCISEGKYIIKLYNSPKFDDCIKLYQLNDNIDLCKSYWSIDDSIKRHTILKESKVINDNLIEVDGRSGILIHAGNTVANFDLVDQYSKVSHWKKESNGCILVGTSFQEYTDTKMMEQGFVYNSRKALEILIDYVKNAGGIEEIIIE